MRRRAAFLRRAARSGVLSIPLSVLLSICGSLLLQGALAAQGTNPCSASQCSTLLKGGFQCGTAAPYACVTTGGCYQDSASAQSGCANNWCYFAPCAAPVSTRATRTITFVNNCQEAFAVYQDSTQIIPSSSFASGSTQTRQVTLTAATNGWGATYYQSGTGVAFRAFPDDQDLSNSTLFEINFGAYSGSSDVYDLSAIPPSSCAGHMQTTDNQYGWADHLPFKSPTNSAQNWDCLKKADGTVDPGTCGDGVGWALCPAVTASTGVAGTVQPPTAKNGNPVVYGCGVSGEQCCDPTSKSGTCTAPNPAVSQCCPNVCAVTGSQNPTDPSVRNLVHNCAYQQSVTVAKNLNMQTKASTVPRQTGFWKGMAVAVSQSGTGCKNISCNAGGTESAPTFNNMSATCADGYLWPFDDASATVTCNAAPDYKVTFCPGSSSTARPRKP